MASSTAAARLMTAAARRLSSRSCSTTTTASSMVLREVSGSHNLTIDGYKVSKKLPTHKSWYSKPFTVAGHSWRIRYYPHGDSYGDGNRHAVGLYLELNPTAAIKEATCDVDFKLSLLDQSGNPVPELTRALVCAFEAHARCYGFREFATWSDLEASGCLRDDRFAVRCDITVTTDVADDLAGAVASPASIAAAVPAAAPNKMLREHLAVADLLWKHKHGADVAVDVGGEAAFDAHGWVLADRSPVLKADLELLAAASNSKKPSAAAAAAAAGGGAQRRIEIKGVEPKVFEAVLRYMYTNALPEKMEEGDGGEEDAMAMAQGILAAAGRFKLDGLKRTCEETLSRSIGVSTAAGILAVAERHGCGALKAACLEFLVARPENLKAVMETEGYEKARAVVHPLVMEIGMKQWLASQSAGYHQVH
ncbi:unnamed protein product [Urochloa humidicola]